MNKTLICITLLWLTTASTTSLAGGHGKGRFIQFFDTNKDGTVTLDEFNESAKVRFQNIDSDKDGKASREEFHAYIKLHRAEHKKRKFAKLDVDQNGQISKQEYITYKVKKASNRFTKMDADGNGTVSIEELMAGKRGKHKRHGHKIFKHIDDDNDGQLTQTESHEAWLNWFKRIDSNSDNIVTDDEIQAHRQQRRKDPH